MSGFGQKRPFTPRERHRAHLTSIPDAGIHAPGGWAMKIDGTESSRRTFLKTAGTAAIGLSASALAGCTRTATAPEVAPAPAATDYPAGDFIVRRVQGGLQVLHKRGGDRVIWATAPGGDFIGAEVATASIKEVGAPQGTFEIADTVQATYARPTIDSINANANKIAVTGKLSGCERQHRLCADFRSGVDDASSVFDLRRQSERQSDSPRCRVSEGRSDLRLRLTAHVLQPEGQAPADTRAGAWHWARAAGDHGARRTSSIIAAAAIPITRACRRRTSSRSRLRSMFLENLEYSEFDMRPAHSDIDQAVGRDDDRPHHCSERRRST